jgi:hypothetical protein
MERIRIVKLVTGEDIVGMVTDKENVIVIVRPFQLVTRPVSESVTKFHLGFMPWAPFADKYTVPIMKHTIVSVFAPDEGVLGEYKKLTENPDSGQRSLLNEESEEKEIH